MLEAGVGPQKVLKAFKLKKLPNNLPRLFISEKNLTMLLQLSLKEESELRPDFSGRPKGKLDSLKIFLLLQIPHFVHLMLTRFSVINFGRIFLRYFCCCWIIECDHIQEVCMECECVFQGSYIIRGAVQSRLWCDDAW